LRERVGIDVFQPLLQPIEDRRDHDVAGTPNPVDALIVGQDADVNPEGGETGGDVVGVDPVIDAPVDPVLVTGGDTGFEVYDPGVRSGPRELLQRLALLRHLLAESVALASRRPDAGVGRRVPALQATRLFPELSRRRLFPTATVSSGSMCAAVDLTGGWPESVSVSPNWEKRDVLR
jgi:hypothetical protein